MNGNMVYKERLGDGVKELKDMIKKLERENKRLNKVIQRMQLKYLKYDTRNPL